MAPIDQMIAELRSTISEGHYYPALALALALPDVCGRLCNPEDSSRKRYVDWCRKYVEPAYTHSVGPEYKQCLFLHAEDLYALRCAFLHEGRDDIQDQRARKVIERFKFLAPTKNMSVHCNMIRGQLGLQVDLFCYDICLAVERWLSTNPNVAEEAPLISIGTIPTDMVL